MLRLHGVAPDLFVSPSTSPPGRRHRGVRFYYNVNRKRNGQLHWLAENKEEWMEGLNAEDYASLKEFVGMLGLWQCTEAVIQGYFEHFKRFVPVRFSGSHFGLANQDHRQSRGYEEGP